MSDEQRRWPRLIPALGIVGSLLLAFSLPPASWASGLAVLVAGLALRLVRR